MLTCPALPAETRSGTYLPQTDHMLKTHHTVGKPRANWAGWEVALFMILTAAQV